MFSRLLLKQVLLSRKSVGLRARRDSPFGIVPQLHASLRASHTVCPLLVKHLIASSRAKPFSHRLACGSSACATTVRLHASRLHVPIWSNSSLLLSMTASRPFSKASA